MSNIKATEEAETFASKLDIMSVSTRMYEQLIDLHANTPKVVIAAVGESGIGKSAIPVQRAKLRRAPIRRLHMNTMGQEDWYIPAPSDKKGYYSRRIPHLFEEIIEYTANLRRENNGEFPEGRNPIIVLEEINRTADKHVTRQAFTLLDDRMIGDVRIDDAIQLIVTMNPSGGGMSVNAFEKDPACLRRLSMVSVTCSFPEFMKYARSRKLHPQVIALLEAQPSMLYDREAVAASKKYACPASWETVSQVAYALDKAKLSLLGSEARAAFSGVIGLTGTEKFLEYVEDKSVVISPEEVLRGYLKDSSVRERFLKLASGGRNDKVTALASNVAQQMIAGQKKFELFAKQLGLFLDDLPEDVTIRFIKSLSAYAKDNDAYPYFLAFSAFIATNKSYNETVARLKRSQKRAEEEAEKTG